MNRTVFSLPPETAYTRPPAGFKVTRLAQAFTGGTALDDLIVTLDRRRGVVLSSGTTVPGRYESFDLGFADPPLALETTGEQFSPDGAEYARRNPDRISRRYATRSRVSSSPTRPPHASKVTYPSRRRAGR